MLFDILFEGYNPLDAETNKITRVIVNLLKTLINEEPVNHSMAIAKANKRDLGLEDILKTQQKGQYEDPIVNLLIVFRSGDPPVTIGGEASTGIKYKSDRYKSRNKPGVITIEISTNGPLLLSDLNDIIIPRLKETVRHELEHNEQWLRQLKHDPERLDKKTWFKYLHKIPTTEDFDSKAYSFDNTFTTVEDLFHYFMSAAETEAFVVGLMVKAKHQKKPFKIVVQEYLKYLGDLISDENKINPLKAKLALSRVRRHWMQYARLRYPNAIKFMD